MAKEIAVQELNTKDFIHEKVEEIQRIVKDGMAINALSGGVDSSTVTMLGHRALGDRLKTVFIENGLMREGESEKVAGLFKDLGSRLTLSMQKMNSLPHSKASRIRKRNVKRLLRPFTKMYLDVSSKKVVQNTFFKGPY